MEKILSATEHQQLIATLKTRFEKHTQRHPNLSWAAVEIKLLKHPTKLWSLFQMEQTGGEPDVMSIADEKYAFVDFSAESPKGRRSLCYDRESLEARKANKPTNSALDLAAEMGIELLDETEYRALQKLGHFDSKTSSWIKTPGDIRDLDGALFADYRFGKVFVYHNTAQSYYSSRGFRGKLLI